jgi:hypothetical protein
MKIKTFLLSASLALAFVSTVFAADIPKLAGPGTRVNFSASAGGEPTPTIEWIKDDQVIATGPTFSIASMAAGNAGTYWVRASNKHGSAVSNDRIVLEYGQAPTPPVISVTLATLSVIQKSTVRYTVNVPDADSLQWYRNGLPLSGQTAATISLLQVRQNQGGIYGLVASKGSARSALTEVFDLKVTNK